MIKQPDDRGSNPSTKYVRLLHIQYNIYFYRDAKKQGY